jgi:hypothetical protein
MAAGRGEAVEEVDGGWIAGGQKWSEESQQNEEGEQGESDGGEGLAAEGGEQAAALWRGELGGFRRYGGGREHRRSEMKIS